MLELQILYGTSNYLLAMSVVGNKASLAGGQYVLYCSGPSSWSSSWLIIWFVESANDNIIFADSAKLRTWVSVRFLLIRASTSLGFSCFISTHQDAPKMLAVYWFIEKKYGPPYFFSHTRTYWYWGFRGSICALHCFWTEKSVPSVQWLLFKVLVHFLDVRDADMIGSLATSFCSAKPYRWGFWTFYQIRTERTDPQRAGP